MWGDPVSCFCSTQRVGSTSITLHEEPWARRCLEHHFDELVKLDEGNFNFMALNENGSKLPVPRDAMEE